MAAADKMPMPATVIGTVLLLGAVVTNLVWNLNSISNLGERMAETACATDLGGTSAAAVVRNELLVTPFGARFSSWIITGIQAAIFFGGMISMMVQGDRKTAKMLFYISYGAELIMLVLYGVLLGFGFNNGVAYAWGESTNCVGSYKNTYSQAGLILASALLAGVFSILHATFTPMDHNGFVKAVQIWRGKRTGSQKSFVPGFATIFPFVISLSLFLGQAVIAFWLWSHGAPTVQDNIVACGNITHEPTPPDWLINVGEKTDANGHNMVLGISIVSIIYLFFTVATLIYEYTHDIAITTKAGRDSREGINELGQFFKRSRLMQLGRMLIVFFLLVMWGRLVYIGNSNWLPQIFDSLRNADPTKFGCTAPDNYSGAIIWVGLTLVIAGTILHEGVSWSHALSDSKGSIHPHVARSIGWNSAAPARSGFTALPA